MRYARYAKAIALALAVAAALLFGDASQLYVTFTIVVLYYMILSIGWNIIGGYAYLASFAQAAFASLAGYISSGFIAYTGTYVPVGMVVAIAAITALAYGLGHVTLKMSGSYLALATIAFSQTIMTILLVNPQVTGGGAGYFPPALIPSGTIAEYYYIFIGVTAVCFYISYRLIKSKTGILMKAIGNDEDAARSLGVDVRRIRLIAFTLSGLFAAVAGTLYAHYFQVIVPADGSLTEMATIMTGPLVGGVGTLLGPVIGTTIIISFRQYAEFTFGAYDVLVFGLLMIFVMKFAPNGIVGIFSSRRIKILGHRIISAYRRGKPATDLSGLTKSNVELSPAEFE